MRAREIRPEALHRGPRWRVNRLSLVPALVSLIGVSMFLYPDAAAWVTQYNQSKIIEVYEAQVDNAEPEAAIQLRQARRYNEALRSGAVLDANANKPRGTGTAASEIFDYNHQLRASETGLMARIRIPKINVDLPIYHGTSELSLLSGAGHLEGTSLPVGGIDTRSVITAHRGLAEAEMFTNLDKVSKGDTFSIEVFGEILTYKIINTEVIEPEATEAIRAEEGKDLATLITCTPLGINSHRILVTGERILPTPAAELAQKGAKPAVPFFPWWAVFYSLALSVISLYLWWAGRPVLGGKKNKKERRRRHGRNEAENGAPDTVPETSSVTEASSAAESSAR